MALALWAAQQQHRQTLVALAETEQRRPFLAAALLTLAVAGVVLILEQAETAELAAAETAA